LVTDTGGWLAPAVTKARKYGIPVVVGTCSATIVINNGDVIGVDGNNGRIIITSRAKQQSLIIGSLFGASDEANVKIWYYDLANLIKIHYELWRNSAPAMKICSEWPYHLIKNCRQNSNV
jgi:hypothetical protein